MIRLPRAGSSTWVVAELGFGAIARIIAFTLVAHLTSPLNLGRYVLLNAVAAVISEVGSLGLSRLGIRFVAANRGQRSDPALMAHVGFVALVGGAVTALVTLAGGLLLLGSLGVGRAVALPFALWVGADAAREGLSGAQRGRSDHRRAALLGDGGRLLMFLLALAVGASSLSETGLLGVAWIAAAASLATVLLGAVVIRPQRWRSSADEPDLIPLLEGSLGTVTTGVTSIVGRSAELWIAAVVVGAAGAGRYAAGSRAASLLALPAVALATVTAPRLARSQDDPDEIGRWLHRATLLATAGTVALAATIVLGRTQLLEIVLGGHRVGGAPTVLLILAAAQALNVAAGPGGAALIVRGHASWAARVTLATTAGGLAVGAIAGARFGVRGLALGVAVGIAVRCLVLSASARRRLGLPIGVLARPAR